MEAIRQKIHALLGEEQSHHYPRFIEEKFPHILEKMAALWGKQQMAEYLSGLMRPPGPYSRGFPSEVIAEIQRIHQFHNEKFPVELVLNLVKEAPKSAASQTRLESKALVQPPSSGENVEDLLAADIFDRNHRW